MNKLKKIVLCINPDCDADFAVTTGAKTALERAGYHVVISVVYVRGEVREAPNELGAIPLEKAVEGADLLISFGGDGTILKVARAVMSVHVPLLGVNLGHKGFMAELDPGDIEGILKAAAGDFIPVKRMMLNVELWRDGVAIFSDTALNDIVLGSTARTVNIETYGDGSRISAYLGDGVIIATPTGATAYSLAAGGPMVEPTAENILITPICAHLITTRPYVLAPDRRVTVKTPNNAGKKLWLSVDGCEPITVMDSDELNIVKSENYTVMARVTEKSFYDIAFEKLGG